MNRRTPPHARTRTWQSPLIALLCSLWVSTDKQCDDQRPLIALRGRARVDKDWSLSGKDWKRPGISIFRKRNEKRKTSSNKGLPCPLCSLAALLITLYMKFKTITFEKQTNWHLISNLNKDEIESQKGNRIFVDKRSQARQERLNTNKGSCQSMLRQRLDLMSNVNHVV